MGDTFDGLIKDLAWFMTALTKPVLDEKGMEQTLRLVDRLEELDDVQTVYTNLDLTGAEELMASMI